jgi:hypothetical protein
MNSFFYTPDEIVREGESMPTKGLFCPACETYIPYAFGMTQEVETILRAQLSNGKRIEVINTLRQQVGFPLSWTKIWVLHPNGPEPAPPAPPATPYPYCGKPLRTAQAKQCRFCRRDWHDPNNLRFLQE